MKKLLFIIGLLTIRYSIIAQTADTSSHNHLKADIHESNWCIAGSIGFQKRPFAGAGIAKTWFVGSSHGVYGTDIYSGINYYPALKKAYKNIMGYKLGADVFGGGFFLGAEVQYLQSKGVDDFLFTPRCGIGISALYIAYGYSISSNKFPIAGISQNSITLQLNFPFYSKNKLTGKVTHWNKKEKK
jgi:hypothetical protein